MTAFPKIQQFGARGTELLFNGPVTITEKMDGSQAQFRVTHEGQLVVGSKRQFFTTREDCNRNFAPLWDFAASIQDQIVPGVTHYGEFFRGPKQNILVYDNAPKGGFCLFAMKVPNEGRNDEWLDYEDLELAAVRYGCAVVPLLFEGELDKDTCLDVVDMLLKRPSFLGGPNIEGVVISNNNVEIKRDDEVQTIVTAKIVSAEFREKMGAKVKVQRDGPIQSMQKALTDPARWAKAVQAMRDDGTLAGDNSDIGKLMKWVNEDFQDENSPEDLAMALWAAAGKEVLRGVTNGLPQWYKEQLANGD